MKVQYEHIEKLVKNVEQMRDNYVKDEGVSRKEAQKLAIENILDSYWNICPEMEVKVDRSYLRNRIKAELGLTNVEPLRYEVKEIVENHHKGANIHKRNGVVMIQLHSNKGLQDILKELTKNDYSFDLSQDFEVPPQINVRSVINPVL